MGSIGHWAVGGFYRTLGGLGCIGHWAIGHWAVCGFYRTLGRSVGGL